MPISTAGKPRNSQRGFSYVMVLAAVVVLGVMAEIAVVTQSQLQKREREQELLFRGMAYRDAIRSYYEAGKPVKKYPAMLEELIKDSRSAHRRHLRQIYSDPLQRGKAEWNLLRAPDGGIMGVASVSTDNPLKKSDFPAGLEQFESAKSYADWVFSYTPVQKPAGIPAQVQAPADTIR